MSMDYSTIYFNKPLQLLEYQDIVNYFVETKEESTTIEFKAYSALYGNFTNNLEGVIKTICAYLNSEGGILIWGAPVGAFIEGQNVKSYQGVLSPLTEFKEKDWLINKISDSITPLPVGINVTVLQNEINYVYVFEEDTLGFYNQGTEQVSLSTSFSGTVNTAPTTLNFDS